MNTATLAVYAGPGDGEQLYRSVAEAFGFPDWQLLWSAVRTGSFGDIDDDAFPELRFDLLEEEGTGRHFCMVQDGRDRKARAAVVACDGAVFVMVRAIERHKLDELFIELAQILAALPGHTRLRVVGFPRTEVYDTTAAELSEALKDAARDDTHPEGDEAEPVGV
ncbi:MAG TPA: hypothetical protein VIK99_07280 [Thermaerobacter sp.]